MATLLSKTSGLLFPTTTRTNTTYPITILSYFRPRLIQTKKPVSLQCSYHGEYIPKHIQHPNYVRVFDTTLRDGEQSPGASMTPLQKLNIARQLAKLGVDIIEVGYPASNKADLETIKMIAHEVGNTTNDDGRGLVICALARCTKDDIDKAWECLRDAKYPRIHIFLATSEIHMKYKLKMSKEEVVEKAKSAVEYARSLGFDDIEFSPKTREVIKAGATTVNIADTVGYNYPREFGQLITDIKTNTPGIENVIISTHCHNDLGLATANTLEGAYSGARQVEVTINGIGERAGNASSEEVIMAIKCKEELFDGLYTGVTGIHIAATSKMVEEYTGMQVQPHKAIVGANVFSHESGIHQDGMLKNKSTYEIISPEDIGLHRPDEFGIILGKHSGRHALKSKLSQLGYKIDETKLNELFWRFKSIAEKKKVITDKDLIGLVSD
ncbi:hypothetical protein SSX86_012802 [Deinandra increscens subsp. villosa]|uniref:Pyruvate carboxyltransferase domain-containing protein n=1 Tax=Deinandra increscens subsp. villosa TaxID=3103831 RepID=A0AAP0DA14_9ASTR